MPRVGRSMRRFHAASAALFKQKNSGQKKIGPPSKAAGEFRSFKFAASYGNHHRQAPDLTEVVELVTEAKDIPSGKMATWSDSVQASLVHLGSFRPQQRNELFKTHTSLIRDVTVLAGQHLSDPTEKWRALIRGCGGVGKSTLLSQVHALAKQQGYAVLHIPQAETLRDGSTDVLPSPDGLWLQPMFVRRWAKRIAKANRDVLPADTLRELSQGKFDPRCAHIVSLVARQAPVLVTVDNVNAWAQYPISELRDRENKRIYNGSLEVIHTLQALISGNLDAILEKGGAVLFATTDTFRNPLDLAENAHEYATVEEYDHKLATALNRPETIEVPRFSSEETATYVSYLQAAGVANEGVSSDAVHVESGNGNPRNVLSGFTTFVF